MRLYSMIGQKIFKEKEDGSIHMMRIMHIDKPIIITAETQNPKEITVYDYEDKQTKVVQLDTLSDYHPLEPDGILTASIVNMRDESGKHGTRDVIISATKFLNLKLGLSQLPFAVCRQSITDIWYNLFIGDESQMMVGLAVNQNNCPTNFEYRNMFACSEVEYSDYVNFYRTDTLEDIYEMLDLEKFDSVLSDLYSRHIKSIKKPQLAFKKEHGGWCKDLKTLLTQNNFQYDINEMLDITQVDFDIESYMEEKTTPSGIPYKVANNELRMWLSLQFKVNMSEANFIEYDHDVNYADYNNVNRILLKDNNKLYLCVYVTEGEYLESDLQEKAKELDFSSKFKIDFYNKWNKNNNEKPNQ